MHTHALTTTPLCSVFERFRSVLHEGTIEKRCQFVIEGLFAVRKAGFEASGYPAVKPELDLVEAGGWVAPSVAGLPGLNTGWATQFSPGLGLRP
jgi:hypothetical protein